MNRICLLKEKISVLITIEYMKANIKLQSGPANAKRIQIKILYWCATNKRIKQRIHSNYLPFAKTVSEVLSKQCIMFNKKRPNFVNLFIISLPREEFKFRKI